MSSDSRVCPSCGREIVYARHRVTMSIIAVEVATSAQGTLTLSRSEVDGRWETESVRFRSGGRVATLNLLHADHRTACPVVQELLRCRRRSAR